MLAAAGARAETAKEPVFGLTYDTTQVHFEAAPADLSKRCPNLVNERYDRRMYVFADTTTGGEEALIIGGFYIPRTPAGDGRPMTDPKGVLLVLSAQGCKLLSPGDETFTDTDSPLAPGVMDVLAKDAIRRFISAFGSAANLKRRLQSQHIKVSAPTLKEAIDQAR